MTREQAKKALKEIGIEPTEEHVTKLLNTVGAEIQKEKENGIKWAEKAARADQMQKEIDNLKRERMITTEKREAEKQFEDAAIKEEIENLKKQIEEANREALASKIKSVFASAGLEADIYCPPINTFYNMPEAQALEVAHDIAEAMADETKSIIAKGRLAWERDALKKTPNPYGGSCNTGCKGLDDSSAASEYAKKYSEQRTQGYTGQSNLLGGENASINF